MPARAALRFGWNRVTLIHLDMILYYARVNSVTAFNVWRIGSYWRWALVTTRELSETDRVVLAWGDGPTKGEAQLRAEQWAAQANVLPPQLGLFTKSPLEDAPNDLPF